MYVYRFDFVEFETGCLTAMRSSQLRLDGPGSDWVCLARDDAEALQLAGRAAMEEWPRPATRSPLDFLVRFTDASQPRGEARA